MMFTDRPFLNRKWWESFSNRDDVPYQFNVIAKVEAAPMRAERDFGHDPILFKKQARDVEV